MQNLGLLTQKSAAYKLKQNQTIWVLILLGFLAVAALLSAYMAYVGPDIRILAWLIFLCGAAAIVYRPRWGIYLVIFFALVGDPVLDPSYPFIKNLSSAESIFFIRDSLIFSPMEIYLVLIFLSWIIGGLLKKDLKFYKGSLMIPATVFIFFITTGLAYGLYKGSDSTIALWEVRPMYHLFALILLTSNLFTRREHFLHLFLWSSLAIVIECVVGAFFVLTALQGQVTALEAITDHPAAIQMNTIFVLFIAFWLYRTAPLGRLAILLVLPVVFIAYIADQRRAAFISLAVALLIFAVLLFYENKRLFLLLIPAVFVVGIVYTGIFWNSGSAAAFPVRALKSVLLPSQATERDQSSNYYRLIENANTSFTIHQRPITGVGFGNPFYVIYNLPDISWFTWWQYFPHNSIIYIWVKAGAFAFLSLLYLVGVSLLTGAQAILHTKDRAVKAILVTAAIYIVMHFLYAYVDISWTTESMLFIGASIGILNRAEDALSDPILPEPVRYPWEHAGEPVHLLVSTEDK